VTNEIGPSTDTDVRVIDNLPAEILGWSWTVTYTPGSGPFDGTPNFGTGSIDKRVNLLVGGSATFTISNAQTSASAKTDIVNVASATTPNGISVETTWKTKYQNVPTVTPALILGTDDGCLVSAAVRVINPVTGGQILAFTPYAGFKGSVHVTSGDVNNDGVADIVVAPGRGIPGLVRVFDAAGKPLNGGAYDFYPFGPAWRGGVEVAVGNVDGAGRNEIIAAMSTGRALVNVFQVGASVNTVPFRSFRPFPATYTAGVMLTVGDYGTYVNGTWTGVPDGKAEIAVGTNPGVAAQVRIYNALPVNPVLVRSFLPFGAAFKQGVTLSSARYSSGLIDDIFVGAASGGKSLLGIYKGSGVPSATTTAFSKYFSKPNATLFTAALDLTGKNGIVNNIYGAQGRGGVNGLPTSLARVAGSSPATSVGSWKAPLRVAPILLKAT
jgi:hypothetical protein